MAIRRCPYCKAIIDESQKYCNNCGTQLLFPQDDAIEENIKGEKIRDDDFRDAELGEEEAGTPPGSAGRGDTRKEIDLGKILDGKASFPDEAPSKRNAGVLPESVDEILSTASARRGGPKPKSPAVSESESASVPGKKTAADGTDEDADLARAILADEPEDLGPDDELPDELAAEAIDKGEEAESADFIADGTRGEEVFAGEDARRSGETEDESRDEGRPEIEAEAEREAVGETEEPARSVSAAEIPFGHFDGDLDGESHEVAGEPDREVSGALSSEDEERDEAETREEIGRLIAALEKKNRKSPEPRPAQSPPTPKKETSGLPAWAEPSPTSELPAMDGKDEAPAEDLGASFAPGDTMDFEEEVLRDAGRTSTRPTIGIPETLSKIEVPAAEGGSEDLEQGDAGAGAWNGFEAEMERTGETAGTGSGEDFVPRRRLGFFGVIKAGIYDLFFVAILWFIAVWLAAEILSLPVKTFLVRATVPLGLLFGVLLVGYLFLFLFFLGETLGVRIASPKR